MAKILDLAKHRQGREVAISQAELYDSICNLKEGESIVAINSKGKIWLYWTRAQRFIPDVKGDK